MFAYTRWRLYFAIFFFYILSHPGATPPTPVGSTKLAGLARANFEFHTLRIRRLPRGRSASASRRPFAAPYLLLVYYWLLAAAAAATARAPAMGPESNNNKQLKGKKKLWHIANIARLVIFF